MRDPILTELTSELPESELRRLLCLRSWVCKHDLTEGRFSDRDRRDELLGRIPLRSAPSIIVRSEAELFGISTPRFAIRATLHGDVKDQNSLGFVNLRRIETLRRSIGNRLGLDDSDEFLTRFHGACRCLGDGFFDPQVRYPEFSVVVTDLAKDYGEQGPALGVPFVTHFPIGGGMCAQAVCFQATALYHRRAKGVFGVSEVTWLAQSKKLQQTSNLVDEARVLDFSGLTIRGIEDYFCNAQVGLLARSQKLRGNFARHIEPSRLSEAMRQAEKRNLAEALRAYVESGIPVIASVGMSHLISSGFYEQLPDLFRGRQPEPDAAHAILVVGVHPESDVFLVNDPAAFPLMTITIDQLDASLTQGLRI